jgi:hypothetical protein
MNSDKKDNMSVNTVSQIIKNEKDENTFNIKNNTTSISNKWNTTHELSKEQINEIEHHSKNYLSKANICKDINSLTYLNSFYSHSNNSLIVNYLYSVE